jgi:hypothetical protein
MLSITCLRMLRPLIRSNPTIPSRSNTSEMLIMEVTYELRILLEYVLGSFFDMAPKMAVAKIEII